MVMAFIVKSGWVVFWRHFCHVKLCVRVWLLLCVCVCVCVCVRVVVVFMWKGTKSFHPSTL